MEGIRYLVVFSLAAMLFGSVGFALTSISGGEPTYDDTWNVTATIGAYPILNQSIAHETNTTLVISFGSASKDIYTKMKFNFSDMQGKVIQNISFGYQNPIHNCGSDIMRMGFWLSDNITWNGTTNTGGPYNGTFWHWRPANGYNYLNSSAGVHYLYFPIHNLTGTTKEAMNGTATFLGRIYNATDNLTFILNEDGGGGAGGCGIDSQTFNISSLEGTMAPRINYTITDYVLYHYYQSDVANFFYDFESQTNSTTNFTEADFYYDLTNNYLYPYVPAAYYFAGSSENTANGEALETTSCATLPSSSYSLAPIHYINTDPLLPNRYITVCFNLSANHKGQYFTGAIKFLQNRNTVYNSSGCVLDLLLTDTACKELEFSSGIYSPDFTEFSFPVLNPDPPIGLTALNISFNTIHDDFAWVIYSYFNNNTGVWSPDVSINETFENNVTKDYETTHSVIIPATNMFPFYYYYQLAANDSTGTVYYSAIYDFTAVGYGSPNGSNWTQTFSNISENTTVPGALQDLVDVGFFPDMQFATWAFGLIIVGIITGFMFWVGGLKIGFAGFISSAIACSIAGLLPIYVFIFFVVIAGFVVVKMIKGGL